MHPDPKVTDEVGMEVIHRHVVDRDVLVQQFGAVYLECMPIALYKQVTGSEVFDEHPPFYHPPKTDDYLNLQTKTEGFLYKKDLEGASSFGHSHPIHSALGLGQKERSQGVLRPRDLILLRKLF